ncbi:hypothetical protein CEXT_787391 [Caerostris extrusa]|uniref:Uncharacterized protein n=1 Tax=Caerostris extrusa TaxID=172846 RepID=A0AAV4VNJ4_CAEEX|nr:hypothetical protein CEXT_787391 [Caerostris extrusa]
MAIRTLISDIEGNAQFGFPCLASNQISSKHNAMSTRNLFITSRSIRPPHNPFFPGIYLSPQDPFDQDPHNPFFPGIDLSPQDSFDHLIIHSFQGSIYHLKIHSTTSSILSGIYLSPQDPFDHLLIHSFQGSICHIKSHEATSRYPSIISRSIWPHQHLFLSCI